MLATTLPAGRTAIVDAARALQFLLAGNAHVTFHSKRTGDWFTYHVELAEERPGATETPPHFVSVLNGPEQYAYIGNIWRRATYAHGRKSRIDTKAPSTVAFAWVFGRLVAGRIPETVDIYHEGKCGRCGRRLTTPESVTSGIGPECLRKLEGG